jgi:hypothetical protein
MPLLYVLPFTLLVVVGELYQRQSKLFVKSLNFRPHHHPISIRGEQERLVTASPVMTKSRAPAGVWGEQLPGERPRETAET